MNPTSFSNSYKQNPLDYILFCVVLTAIAALSLFQIRNNDIWWHMAVGREIVSSRHFFSVDSFSFTTLGHSWTPQSYLAGVIFYLIHMAGSTYGLIALRTALVVTTFAFMMKMLGGKGISFAFASPFVLVAALNMHSRFIIRPHLFEYLFLAVLIWILLSEKRAFLFYAVPAIMQILWVNMHPSFYLGPIVVLIFLAGEAARRFSRGKVRFFRSVMKPGAALKPLLILLLLLIGVSLINPSPLHFFTQPLGGYQRELISKYTLEWRSPFDPALKSAAFHPYYEIMLFVVFVCFALSINRMQPASFLLALFFALLSIKAHRFRVEFALTALPLALLQLQGSFLTCKLESVLNKKRGRLILARSFFAVAAVAILVFTARDRIAVGGSLEDKYPSKALNFAMEQGIGTRSFHPIRFGSYLLWDKYPDMRSFIDGRNVAPEVYQDFIDCQKGTKEFSRIVNKYNLDSFIIPLPQKCDKGMLNIHGMLIKSAAWPLVYMDHIAFIYIRRSGVSRKWLESKEYKYYNTMTFSNSYFDSLQVDTLISEIKRSVQDDPAFLNPWVDLGSVYLRKNQPQKAAEAFKRAIDLAPERPILWYNAGMACMRMGAYENDRQILH